MKNEKKGGEKSPRSLRYGKLVRGWDWRTTPERLRLANELRVRLGIGKTEFLERAIDEFIERNG